MTARTMADSTTVADLPEWVSVKAFYVDGIYAATVQQIDAWKGPKVLINVTGDPGHGGDMLDVETGDATPAAIPAWYDAQAAKGTRYLGVYSNRDNFTACTQALGARPAARWLATLDGTVLHTFDGHPIAACQAFGEALVRAHYDLSLIFDETWHPEGDVEIPSGDLAHIDHLATIAGRNLASLQRFVKSL